MLILPVEERKLGETVEGVQDYLPGGQAIEAPHEEVVHVNGQGHGDGFHAEVDHETGHVQGQGDDIHKGKGVKDDGQNEGRGVQADLRACVHHSKGRDDGKAYVTGCIRLRLKACALMENDFPSEDFEAALYMQFWEKLDCRKVDEVNEKLKSVND